MAAVAAGHSTAEYAAILNPDGSLAFGIADMGVFNAITVGYLPGIWPHFAAASWVLAECNLPAPVLQALLARKRGAHFKLAVDPVSVHKAMRLPAELAGIDVLFVNEDEAEALLGLDARHAISPELAAQALRERGAGQVVLTLGADGAVVASDLGDVVAVPAVPTRPVDVTGAGDALIAATLARLVAGSTLVEAVRIGSLAAALTVESDASVCPEMSEGLLASMAHRLGRAPAPAHAPDGGGEHYAALP
ncbi:MAG: bifunctional hydroxymethylpyrimidine kinase/phosphomethylpyrimidine kinase [Acetobacteraceae bacterium]|nr:bifunctional hydroxymethylpyrimidine kinase/phosphomethylpyrimidine kinase [Acetobacteraceae bacterium]